MLTIIAAWKFIKSPAGLLIISIIAFTAYSYYLYREGKLNGASDIINKQNETDRGAIEDARDLRNDVDRCRARGLRWDRETGKCA